VAQGLLEQMPVGEGVAEQVFNPGYLKSAHAISLD